jgi:hypothetical protein
MNRRRKVLSLQGSGTIAFDLPKEGKWLARLGLFGVVNPGTLRFHY